VDFFVVLLVSSYFDDIAWQKVTTMHFNFLKLLDRKCCIFSRGGTR